MRRDATRIAVLAAGLAVAAIGCQAMKRGLPVELEEGRGRVDRTWTKPFDQVVGALVGALDEHSIAPDAVSLQDTGTALIEMMQANEKKTNAGLNLGQTLDRASEVYGQPFQVRFLTYRGTTTDGRTVHLIARAEPESSQVMVRVGRNGDEAKATAILDAIATRLDQPPKPAP